MSEQVDHIIPPLTPHALVEPRRARPQDLSTGSPIEGSARPVAVDLRQPDGDAVRRWVEGVLGWQPVDGTTAALVPPTVRLIGADSDPPDDGVPRVLLLTGTPSAEAAANAVIRTGARGVVRWPEQRDRLPAIVMEVVARPGTRVDQCRVLTVGGVAGGVGTTTVALALAGLAGWRGTSALAAIRGDAPVRDLPVVAPAAVEAPDLWARLPAPPGARNTRAVRIADPGPIAVPRDPGVHLAVLDHGVDVDVDVVVCRPDAAALEHLPTTTAAVILVVGTGPVGLRALGRVAAGRRGIWLPWSARVARAGARRRVPGGLPGNWLRRLAPLVAETATD